MARTRLKKALEAVENSATSEPQSSHLNELKEAATSEDLPQEEREQGLQVLRRRLSAHLDHHCKFEAQSSMLEFAGKLRIACNEHVAMDEENMKEVMQKFNARIRAQLEAAIMARSIDQLREVVDVLQQVSFPRYWPPGDEGDRQSEEFAAWAQEAGSALEREESSSSALESLEEAAHGPSISYHRGAFAEAQGRCDPADLVGARAVLQAREDKLAELKANLSDAVSPIRDTERPPTEEEYYKLLDLFNEASKKHLQADDIAAWDEARRALRESLTRLGEG